MSTILYKLYGLAKQAKSSLNDVILAPKPLTASIETMEHILETELKRIEENENRIDAIQGRRVVSDPSTSNGEGE